MCQPFDLRGVLLFGLLLCAASSVGPPPVAACGACTCTTLETWWNDYGFVDGPANARVLVPVAPGEAVRLVSVEGGEQVAIETAPSGVEGLLWVKPRDLLTVGQHYRVEASVGDRFEALSYMRVTGGADVAAPDVEGVSIEAALGSPVCDLDRSANITVESIRDDASPGGRVIAQIDIDTGASQQRVFVPFFAFTQTQIGEIGSFASAEATCMFGRGVTSSDPDEPAAARVTIYDLGGNATELAERFEFDFGEVRGGACPMGHPPAPAAGSGAPAHDDAAQDDDPVAAHGGGCHAARGTEASAGSFVATLLLVAMLSLRRRSAGR